MTSLPDLPVSQKTYQNSGNSHVLNCVPEDAIRIIDIGCGAGDNARQLARKDRTIVGVTLSEDEAKVSREVCDSIIVTNVEDGIPQAEGQFDVAICSHVLGHICYPQKLLADLRGMLGANGLLIVALPNLMWYKTRWRISRGQFEYEPHGIMDNTHFRWYTFASAQRMLSDNGFHVVSARAHGSLPLGPLRRCLPPQMAKWLDSACCRVFPGMFGFQHVYVARVKRPS